jgi:hypothetical protein
MALPTNAPFAYQSGYKAASAAIRKRKGKRLPTPSATDCQRWANAWSEYLTGWKQAMVEARDRDCRWESQE